MLPRNALSGVRDNRRRGIGRTMLSGFNTNFRHRGILFHVQTEDSGRANPHVITHLFHGGNILASEKRDYSDLLEQEDIAEPVRKLMEGQHKSMLRRLSRGEHDGVIEERLGADLFRGDTESTDAPPQSRESPPGSTLDMPSVLAEPTGLGGELLEPELTSAPAPGSFDPPDVSRSRTSTPPMLSRVFGDRIVSEKPLDEVVLDYLVENARKRKRKPK